MKLKTVYIQNFRAIGQCHLELDPRITIIVGDNGSGKTAILDSIRILLSPLVSRMGGSPKRVESHFPKIPYSDVRQVTPLEVPVPSWDGSTVKVAATSVLPDMEWSLEFSWDPEDDQSDESGLRGRISLARPDMLASFDRRQTDLPVLAYYGIDRGCRGPEKQTRWRTSGVSLHPRLDRRGALQNALDVRTLFDEVTEWFDAVESQELRLQRENNNPGYRDPQLDCVRRAVEAMIENVSNLRMTGLPPKLTVDFTMPNGRKEPLHLHQLSGGYRLMLSLVADLARRMAMLNPHLPDPLQSEGVVLIDEIDLHLHPKWQQEVMYKLKNTFQNVQFIVATHSELVLTTFYQHNVRKIMWSGDILYFDESVTSTYGAESGRIQSEVMGVSQRPPARMADFVDKLEFYRQLVRNGRWDSAEAEALLQSLHRMSPDDPILISLEMERRRLSVRR